MNLNDKISELLKGIQFVGETTYVNYIDAFELTRDEYGTVTWLEAAIPSIFMFDFLLPPQYATVEFRTTLHNEAVKAYVTRFQPLLKQNRLEDFINQRFNGYIQIPRRAREKWHQNLIGSLELLLGGTGGITVLQDQYPLVIQDVFDALPKQIKFRELEILNVRLAMSITKDIFDGKDFMTSMMDFYAAVAKERNE